MSGHRSPSDIQDERVRRFRDRSGLWRPAVSENPECLKYRARRLGLEGSRDAGQSAEADAIFGWLAEGLSPDTYVNIMGQYRPEYEVGQIARDGVALQYPEIGRRPEWEELERAREAAHRAGLRRFDERQAG